MKMFFVSGFIVLICAFFFMGCTQNQATHEGLSQTNNTTSIQTHTPVSTTQTYACPDGSVVTDLNSCPKPKCSDGTSYAACSSQKPKFCQEGHLVDNAAVCGCPSGYDVSGDTCVPHVDKCDDGTLYDQCSQTKPKYCSRGALIDNASSCGCPSGYLVQNNSCAVELKCNDGTKYNSCSTNNPLFCTQSGELVHRASTCGCNNFNSNYVTIVAGDDCQAKYWTNSGQIVDVPGNDYSGALRITINSIKITKPDSAGVQRLELDLTAKNIGNDDASIYCWTGIDVFDAANHKYSGSGYKFGDQLNPGLSTTGLCNFEMPSTATPYKIVFTPLFGEEATYTIKP